MYCMRGDASLRRAIQQKRARQQELSSMRSEMEAQGTAPQRFAQGEEASPEPSVVESGPPASQPSSPRAVPEKAPSDRRGGASSPTESFGDATRSAILSIEVHRLQAHKALNRKVDNRAPLGISRKPPVQLDKVLRSVQCHCKACKAFNKKTGPKRNRKGVMAGKVFFVVYAAVKFRRSLQRPTVWHKEKMKGEMERAKALIVAREAEIYSKKLRLGAVKRLALRGFGEAASDGASAVWPVQGPTSPPATKHTVKYALLTAIAESDINQTRARHSKPPDLGTPHRNLRPWLDPPPPLSSRGPRRPSPPETKSPPLTARARRVYSDECRKVLKSSSSTMATNLAHRFDVLLADWDDIRGSPQTGVETTDPGSPSPEAVPTSNHITPSTRTLQPVDSPLPRSPLTPASTVSSPRRKPLSPASHQLHEPAPRSPPNAAVAPPHCHLAGYDFVDKPFVVAAPGVVQHHRYCRQGSRVNRRKCMVPPRGCQRTARHEHFKAENSLQSAEFHQAVHEELHRVQKMASSLATTKSGVLKNADYAQPLSENLGLARKEVARQLKREADNERKEQQRAWFNDFARRILELSTAPECIELLNVIREHFETNRLTSKHLQAIIARLQPSELYNDNVQFILFHTREAFGTTLTEIKQALRRRYVHCRLSDNNAWSSEKTPSALVQLTQGLDHLEQSLTHEWIVRFRDAEKPEPLQPLLSRRTSRAVRSGMKLLGKPDQQPKSPASPYHLAADSAKPSTQALNVPLPSWAS
eukprot:Sspe_Gene.41601::Locus_20131_Transcript_1_1_Confidence_1.000_Length_2437::g.41601::m.41601